MPNPVNYIEQLAEYILSNLEKGYTEDALRFSLVTQGYTRISVDKAIDLANKQLAKEIPPIKEKPQIKYRIILDDSKVIEREVDIDKKPFWKRLF